jgi:CHAT domain-containing protein
MRFPALPGVREELSGIVRDIQAGSSKGVLPGTLMIDEAFTADAMKTSLRLHGSEQAYKVVHIASHFNFQPGDETKSFLLLGDGTALTLTQLKRMSSVFSKVELLTLSACNTATGGEGAEGKEVEGFAVLAQRQGAQAIVASLWPVSDASTSELMQEFYQLRDAGGAGMEKAEALRQSQLLLLHGSEKDAGLLKELRGPGVSKDDKGIKPNQKPFTVNPKAPFSHPYYWAPFILIGNFR